MNARLEEALALGAGIERAGIEQLLQPASVRQRVQRRLLIGMRCAKDRLIAKEQVRPFERDQRQYVVGQIQRMQPPADTDLRKVELRAAFIEEVFPVTTIEQHAGLTDALQSSAVVGGEERRNARGIRHK